MPYWGLVEPFALFFLMLLAFGFLAWVYRRARIRFNEAKFDLERVSDPDYQDAMLEVETFLQKHKDGSE